jgi:hypothetical protein
MTIKSRDEQRALDLVRDKKTLEIFQKHLERLKNESKA